MLISYVDIYHISDKKYNGKESSESPCLENLLSCNYNEKNRNYKEKSNLYEYKLRNINQLKEDLLYYYSSPETLLNYEKINEYEINYEFYKYINGENFVTSQKERNKLILSTLNSKPITKEKTINDYNSFMAKNSIVENNDIITQKLINLNIISQKLEEYSNLYLTENDDNKIVSYLNEFKDIIIKNNIDNESLGFIHYKSIESYFCLVLNLIIKNIEKNNNIQNMITFVLNCIDILKYFKSINMLFLKIKFLKKHQNILESLKFKISKDIIHFVPNNCINFEKIYNSQYMSLIDDLNEYINNQNCKELNSINIFDKKDVNLYYDYWTFNYNDFLFIFIKTNNIDFLLYLEINLIDKKCINLGKINLPNKRKLIDINISIKLDFIYIFYLFENIVNNNSKYCLKTEIYNQYTINLIKENEIELENSFIPTKLLNDNKYLYCLSNSNKIFIIKKNYKLNNQKYANCVIISYDKDMKFNKELNSQSIKMYNCLSINDLIIIDDIDNKNKYIGKFICTSNDNYLINVFEFSNYQNKASEENYIGHDRGELPKGKERKSVHRRLWPWTRSWTKRQVHGHIIII